MSVLMRIATRGFGPWPQVRRAEPWTGSAECYGSVASIRRITSLYPPYNSSLVGGLRLKERKAKSKSHSFLVRRPTRRSRGRGVTLWPVSPSLVRPRPLALALGASEERAWARRAGRFAGNFGPWLSCPVRHGCPVWPFAKSGLSQVLAFWYAGGRGLVAPSGGLSVCATRFFRLRPGSVLR